MSPPPHPHRARRNRIGEIWLQQRPRAWLWATAFVVVVLAVLVVLYGLGPSSPPAA